MKNINRNISGFIALLLMLSFFPVSLSAQGSGLDSLDYYIALAIENNPTIKAQKLIYEADLQRIPQAGAFADPEFSGEFYTDPMHIIGGRSLANFSVMQQLPWFGTRKNARIEAGYEADMQFQQFQSEADELILQIYVQWYSMQKLNQQIQNNREHMLFLKNLEELTLIKYSAATGPYSANMSDVLRIQMEEVELENNIESLVAFLASEKARFNALLNREADEPVHIGSEIIKSEILFDVENVLESIDTNNPDLLKIEKELLAYQAKAEKDRKMSYPTIGFGAQYMLVGKTNEEMFKMGSMNGRDMIMPMVSVSLPIFRKKYDAQQEETALLQQAAQEKRAGTLNNLKAEFYSLKNQLEDAERIIALYEKQTDLASTTYNLVVQEFTAGKGNLNNVIEVQRQLLDYQLKKVEAVANYNIMAISIAKLTSFTKN